MNTLVPLAEPVDARDQFNLGFCYENGEGVPRDLVLAASWYRKSAEQGYADAQNSLGICYVNGNGVAQNEGSGFAWFRKAAEQGFAASQYNLGILHANGRGTQRHCGVAAAWYRKAAKQGHTKAQLKLRKLLDSGVVEVPDELLKLIDPDCLNADIKKRQQARRADVFRRLEHVSDEPKVAVTSCPICGTRIAKQVFKNHLRDYHRPEPKPANPHHIKPPKNKVSTPTLPTLPTLPMAATLSAVKPGAPKSLCPRCGGYGGVKSGCRKCDGTGWVPEEMEHERLYSPNQHVCDNSKVSNADYLGGNRGAHFRERDGRIGTIPMHDDYSEES